MTFISSASSTRSTGSPGQWFSREGAGRALDHPERPPFPPTTLPLSLFSSSGDFLSPSPCSILQGTLHKRENSRVQARPLARCNRLIQHMYAAVQKETYGACHECNGHCRRACGQGPGLARPGGPAAEYMAAIWERTRQESPLWSQALVYWVTEAAATRQTGSAG